MIQRGRSTLVRPYPISIEWPIRWLDRSSRRQRVPRERAATSSGSRPTRCSASASIASTTPRASRSGCSRSSGCSSAIPEFLRALHLRAARGAEPHAHRALSQLNERVERVAARINARFAKGAYRPIVLLRAHHEPPDGVPLLSRRRPLLREQPARRHEPRRQGVRRGARRRARRAGAQPVHRRGARADRGADRQSLRPRGGERRARRRPQHVRRRAARAHARDARAGRPSSTSIAGRDGCSSTRRGCAAGIDSPDG